MPIGVMWLPLILLYLCLPICLEMPYEGYAQDGRCWLLVENRSLITRHDHLLHLCSRITWTGSLQHSYGMHQSWQGAATLQAQIQRCAQDHGLGTAVAPMFEACVPTGDFEPQLHALILEPQPPAGRATDHTEQDNTHLVSSTLRSSPGYTMATRPPTAGALTQTPGPSTYTCAPLHRCCEYSMSRPFCLLVLRLHAYFLLAD
jgi:hypothetical protein